MHIGFGNGGWVRVTGVDLPGPLFLRLVRDQGGRWRTRELYLEAGEERSIGGRDLRDLPLAAIEAVVLSDVEHLEARASAPGPELGVLASHYATTFNLPRYEPGQNWVVDSIRAQHPGGGTVRPTRARAHKDTPERGVPPLVAPVDGLTDDFLRHVAAAYRAAVRRGESPGPALADQAGVAVRTVHRWIYTARRRGIMPPGERGRVG